MIAFGALPAGVRRRTYAIDLVRRDDEMRLEPAGRIEWQHGGSVVLPDGSVDRVASIAVDLYAVPEVVISLESGRVLLARRTADVAIVDHVDGFPPFDDELERDTWRAALGRRLRDLADRIDP